MGSNYFGDQPNYLGNINERGCGLMSSSSSRKGKKNGSDKPKQPQRGLGVAQLEKIRLHTQQLGCAYLPSLHNNPYASNFIHQDDMRLQTPYSSSSPSYSSFQGHHGGDMMGLPDLDSRANMTYGDSQSGGNVARWNQVGNAGFGTHDQHYFVEPSMTKSFFEQGTLKKKKKKKKEFMMSSRSENFESSSSSSQDIDLELRL